MSDEEHARGVCMANSEGCKDCLACAGGRDDHRRRFPRLADVLDLLQRHRLHRVGNELLPHPRLIAIDGDHTFAPALLIVCNSGLSERDALRSLLVDGPPQQFDHVTVAGCIKLEVPLLVARQRIVGEVTASPRWQ